MKTVISYIDTADSFNDLTTISSDSCDLIKLLYDGFIENYFHILRYFCDLEKLTILRRATQRNLGVREKLSTNFCLQTYSNCKGRLFFFFQSILFCGALQLQGPGAKWFHYLHLTMVIIVMSKFKQRIAILEGVLVTNIEFLYINLKSVRKKRKKN